jgi:hypothetical protein
VAKLELDPLPVHPRVAREGVKRLQGEQVAGAGSWGEAVAGRLTASCSGAQAARTSRLANATTPSTSSAAVVPTRAK